MEKLKDIFVLDIGSRKLSLFTAEVFNEEQKLRNIESLSEVSYSGFKDAKWIDKDEIQNVVSKLILRAKKKLNEKEIDKIYVAVPGEFIKISTKEVTIKYPKTVTVNDSHIDELFSKGSLSNSEKSYETVSCSAIYYTIDDNKKVIDPRGMSVNKLTVLLSYALCDYDLIELFKSALSQNNIEQVNFLSANLAEGITLFNKKDRENNIILCDIGYITSSVMIIRGDGLLDMKSFSLGGGYIASDIMLCLNIPYQTAEEIKGRVDLIGRNENTTMKVTIKNQDMNVNVNDVNSIVKARLDDIVETIKFCMEKFQYNAPPHLPIYITGGGISNIRGAVAYMSKKLNKSIRYVVPKVKNYSRPRYSSACSSLEVVANQLLEENKKTSLLDKILSFFKNKRRRK